MSKPTKVILIGCGMASPVLAVLLRIKGYEPVIYERTESRLTGGLSLCLQVNGLKVLSLIPGLVESIEGQLLEESHAYSMVPGDVEKLGGSDFFKQYIAAKYNNMGLVGAHRNEFYKLLVKTAESHNVSIHWGHKLVSLDQDDDSVTVHFENGQTDTGSFVIGCDGLHSGTRTSLFGQEAVSYTGLTQTGGLSPTPEFLSKAPAMTNVYGEDSHLIAYAVSPTHTSWAITRSAPETRETWRATNDADKLALQESEFAEWNFGAGELVKTTDHIISYGLYDRPALKTWHKGRVCLIGDAAHPTSPHLGQGANQAFEDIYHLVLALQTHNPSAQPPSTEVLSVAFTAYETIRIPRSAQLVMGARKMGETRVVHGREQCLARNEIVRNMWNNQDMMKQGLDAMFSQPYTEKSLI